MVNTPPTIPVDLPTDSSDVVGYRLTRLMVKEATFEFCFTPQSTPAAPFKHKTTLPPASCWSHPEHVAPEPSCRCGYHWFTNPAAAFDYLYLFEFSLTTPRPPISRFVARFKPYGVCEYRPPASSLRAASGSYLGVYLPDACWCSKKAVGLTSYTPDPASEEYQYLALQLNPVAAACRRHLDQSLTAAFVSFLPLYPSVSP